MPFTIIALVIIALGSTIFTTGVKRLKMLIKCKTPVDGRYIDTESVGSLTGEKFRLQFEYTYDGKKYKSLSDGKFSDADLTQRGFTRGRNYSILISDSDPKLCTCRMKNEYVFESTLFLMMGFFVMAAGLILFASAMAA